MVTYLHIIVDSESTFHTVRYFEDDLPKPGTEFVLSSSELIDHRYLVKDVVLDQNSSTDKWRFVKMYCDDISKPFYGPPKPRKTMMGYFHDMDKDIMTRYPQYRSNDYET